MTTDYSVGYAFFNANRFVPKLAWSAADGIYLDSYEASGLANPSTLYFFRPVKGSRWAGIGKIWSDALGASVTLAVGIVGTTAKFYPATSHSAATQGNLGAATEIDQVEYEFDGNTDVIITTGGGAATGTIRLMMQMVVPT